MRLFYCVELSPDVRATLDQIAQPLRKIDARISWVRPENFHITLKFLGEVEPALVDTLKALGEGVAHNFQRFELTFDTVGAFPSVHRPRVLWIGSRQVPLTVFKLQEQLERELLTMSFEAERHFSPHVTVGRVKDEHPMRLGGCAQIISQIKPFACRALITHLTLMESRLAPGGAIYNPVGVWELV